MKQSSSEIIMHLKQGNKEAYIFLYKNFYRKLCFYSFQFVRNYEIAKDIVQGIILKIWENRTSLKVDGNIKDYLYKAVYNNSILHLKKQQNRNRLQNNMLLIDDLKIDFKDLIIEDELKEKISNAIGKLPDQTKEIFIMNRHKGLKYREIAEKNRISVKSVEFHMSKAIKMLKEELVEYIYY